MAPTNMQRRSSPKRCSPVAHKFVGIWQRCRRAFTLLILVPGTVLAEPVIKIGEIDPLTGGVSQYGIGCHQGFLLAIDEINASGGVLGSKLQLISEDTLSKAGQSSTAIRKLIT